MDDSLTAHVKGSLSVMKKLKRCEAFEWLKKTEKKTTVRKTERMKQKERNMRNIMRRIVLPEIKIRLKTPNDSEIVERGKDEYDDVDDDEDNNNNNEDHYHSMGSLQSVETSDSQRTVVKPSSTNDVEESDDEQVDLTEFRQEIRTLASDYDNIYRKKDPDEYTDADIDPQFVNVQRLTKGMHFGVAEFVFDAQPSFCVVSNGAECILFDKQFYLEHAPQRCMTLIRKEVCPFPSDEEMQAGLQTCVDWEAFKTLALNNALREIRARRSSLNEEKFQPALPRHKHAAVNLVK